MRTNYMHFNSLNEIFLNLGMIMIAYIVVHVCTNSIIQSQAYRAVVAHIAEELRPLIGGNPYDGKY